VAQEVLIMSFNSQKNRVAFAALAISLFVFGGCGTDEDKTIVKKDTPAPEKVAQVAVTPPTPSQPIAQETPARVVPVGEVTYEIAERAFLDGHYKDAVDLFTRYTEKKPDNSFGHYMLGLSAWKDGRLDVAETEFQKSLTLDPTHQKSCLNLARVLIDGHRPTEALTVLDRAVAIDSTNSSVYRLKGNALNDLGRDDEAVVAYQSAIQLDPEDAWSMNNLAFIRIREGRYNDALPALARATELRKDVPVFYNNLGMALEHGGHYAAAAEAYGFAVSLDGSNAKAVQNHDRALTVRDDPSLPAVDLTALARQFESEILEGKVATTSARADSVVSVQPR
jgi:Flp pilus assembly protein TadD